MFFPRVRSFLKSFFLPFLVIVGLIAYLVLSFGNLTNIAIIVAFITILLGSYPLIAESIKDIKNKQLGLDYIAILAIVVALVTHEYLVGIILGLMLATGRNLEDYASKLAKKSLSSLAERIPHDIGVEINGTVVSKPVSSIGIDEIIVVRKGEVIPLDGLLISPSAVVDESSLSGEAFPADKYSGDLLRSGGKG
jgi:cation transport ATPase